MRVVTSGAAWYPVNHKHELKNWMLEQSVNNKGCLIIQFFLRGLYQKYKKVGQKVFWGKKVPFPEISELFLGGLFLFFRAGA